MTVIDLYAGPGGWDLGAARLGMEPVGLELDEAACQTRAAAGLLTIRTDVATFPVPPHDGLIASPPCQAFSMAGARKGEDDMDRIVAHLERCRDGWVPLPDEEYRIPDGWRLLGVEWKDTA